MGTFAKLDFAFDEENQLRVLTEAGFKDVRSRDFDPGLDKYERKHESIYVPRQQSRGSAEQPF